MRIVVPPPFAPRAWFDSIVCFASPVTAAFVYVAGLKVEVPLLPVSPSLGMT